MREITVEVKIPAQTRRCTIEVSDEGSETQFYLDGCLDANIHPQGYETKKYGWLSPQGEHSGLDALDCEITEVK